MSIECWQTFRQHWKFKFTCRLTFPKKKTKKEENCILALKDLISKSYQRLVLLLWQHWYVATRPIWKRKEKSPDPLYRILLHFGLEFAITIRSLLLLKVQNKICKTKCKRARKLYFNIWISFDCKTIFYIFKYFFSCWRVIWICS